MPDIEIAHRSPANKMGKRRTSRSRSAGKKDRRPKAPGHAKVDLREAEVPNPYFTAAHPEGPTNPRRVKASRNVNESALVRLEAAGSIDAAEALAGHRYRSLFERLMAAQASPSLLKERVDGGSAADVFSDDRMQASVILRHVSNLLAPEEYEAIRLVCGEGCSLAELDRRLRARKGTAGRRLRLALRRLSEIWGYKEAGYDARRQAAQR